MHKSGRITGVAWLLLLLLPMAVTPKLLMTVWVSRHGAREPNIPYNDFLRPFNESFRGSRVLTNVGTRQHYVLGRAFAARYQGLFPITPATTVVRSSYCARTAMSGQSFILGMTHNDIQPEIETAPKLPIKVSAEAGKMFAKMYPISASTLRYSIYHTMLTQDLITYAVKNVVCPGLTPVYQCYYRSQQHKAYKRQIMSIITTVMNRIFGSEFYQLLSHKLQTLRYANYYGMIPKDFIRPNELLLIEEATKLLILKKGKQQPDITRVACHNIFNQISDLFRFAVMRDRLGPEKFRKLALRYHKQLAERDPAYMPRYRWLKSNPAVVDALRAVVFQNHDELIFMMIKAMAHMDMDKVIIRFAAALAFELHKGKADGDYYVKIVYNGGSARLKMRGCEDASRCPLEGFLQSIRPDGTLPTDADFQVACHVGPLGHHKSHP